MNKNTLGTMAAAVAVAGILTLAVLTTAIQHQAFAQADNQGSSYDKNNQCCEKQQPPCCDNDHNKCCDNDHNKCCDNDHNKQPEKKIDVTATGGNGGSGGAGGAGGEGGQGGTNTVNNMKKSGYQDTAYVSSSSSINQKANGGNANGGHGGNANGGNANIGSAST